MNTVKQIQKAIGEALLQENRFYITAIRSNNPCSVEGCCAKRIVKGLCNTHYIRTRKGQDLNAPTRNRSNKENCIDCGNLVGSKGGFNRCSKHYKRRRLGVIKQAVVNLMGGCCEKCKNSYPLCVYDFHHKNKLEKDLGVSIALANRSTFAMAQELAKCQLLCANCHREVHYAKC